jgi:hypothetical protein
MWQLNYKCRIIFKFKINDYTKKKKNRKKLIDGWNMNIEKNWERKNWKNIFLTFIYLKIVGLIARIMEWLAYVHEWLCRLFNTHVIDTYQTQFIFGYSLIKTYCIPFIYFMRKNSTYLCILTNRNIFCQKKKKKHILNN